MRRYRKIGCIAGAGVGIINLINNGSANQIPLRFGLGAIVGSAVYLSVGEFFSRADLWTKVRPHNREHKKRIDLLRSLPVASAFRCWCAHAGKLKVDRLRGDALAVKRHPYV